VDSLGNVTDRGSQLFRQRPINFVVEAPVLNPSGRPTITRKVAFSDLQGKNVVDASGTAGSRNKAARESTERYGGMGSRTFVRELYNPDLVLLESGGGTQTIIELNLKTKQSRLVAQSGERSAFLTHPARQALTGADGRTNRAHRPLLQAAFSMIPKLRV
jgi:hypothetical protein